MVLLPVQLAQAQILQICKATFKTVIGIVGTWQKTLPVYDYSVANCVRFLAYTHGPELRVCIDAFVWLLDLFAVQKRSSELPFYAFFATNWMRRCSFCVLSRIAVLAAAPHRTSTTMPPTDEWPGKDD